MNSRKHTKNTIFAQTKFFFTAVFSKKIRKVYVKYMLRSGFYLIAQLPLE